MSDSTTILDQLSFAQVEKEVVANELFDAASTAMTFGRHGSACVALTWGYYGGPWSVDSVPIIFDNGTLTLTDNATCYIYFDYSAAADSPPGTPVAFATSPPASWPGPNGNDIPLYQVTTLNGAVTAWLDYRCPPAQGPQGAAGATGATGPAGADGTSSVIPQNSQSTAYTTVLTDAGKHILHPSADTTPRTFTIDSNANVAYPVGTVITFVNQDSAGTLTIAISTDTMRLAGLGTTGSRTLAANGIATALKVASGEWLISGTGLT